MKSADVPFMGWIDHLPKVSDRMRDGRAKLLTLNDEAARLEYRATVLRDQVRAGQVRAGQVELLTEAMKTSTLADIQDAAAAANKADPLALTRNQVNDKALRLWLQQLDGPHLATEALLAFKAAGVIRQQNLLSTANDEERLQTLARVLDWWNHAAAPVCARLAERTA